MAEPPLLPLVEPFSGERFAASAALSARIAPPYDVIAGATREELVARDPYNIVQLILPVGNTDRYAKAAKTLATWRSKEILVRDPEPAVYVVQQEFPLPDETLRVRTGVIGALLAEPYACGRVKPHEHTHAEPKADRLALARALHATFEAIFLLARDGHGHLRRRLDGVTRHKPHAVADLDGVTVGLWRVGGVQGREIARAASEGSLYIADGHHRFETAIAYHAENPSADRLPALIVPADDPGIVALPTHRVIRGKPVDWDHVLDQWRADFTVTEGALPEDLGALPAGGPQEMVCTVVRPGGRQVTLRRARADGAEPVPDIAVIERDVVTPLAAGRELAYTPSAAAAVAAVGSDAAAAVLVRGTPVTMMMAVADAGGVMPPKSTYFSPKVPSGLVGMAYAD
jgi:uncharacterized protein (DUF1015 family)